MNNLTDSKATLTDIVFENRNKLFGAYDLRRHYGRNVMIALGISMVVFTLALVTPRIYHAFFPESDKDETLEEVDLNLMDLKEKEPEDPIVEPPPPAEEPPKVAMSEFLEPEVAPDEKVVKDPPKVDSIVNPGKTDQEGDANLNEQITDNSGDKRIEEKKDEVFLFVAEMPQFKGKNYKEFISENLRYPEKALKEKIQGTVQVEFIIGTDGNVMDARVLKGIGYGCDEEAVRVIKLTKWTSPKQNGVPVKLKKTLPIVFKFAERKE